MSRPAEHAVVASPPVARQPPVYEMAPKAMKAMVQVRPAPLDVDAKALTKGALCDAVATSAEPSQCCAGGGADGYDEAHGPTELAGGVADGYEEAHGPTEVAGGGADGYDEAHGPTELNTGVVEPSAYEIFTPPWAALPAPPAVTGEQVAAFAELGSFDDHGSDSLRAQQVHSMQAQLLAMRDQLVAIGGDDAPLTAAAADVERLLCELDALCSASLPS